MKLIVLCMILSNVSCSKRIVILDTNDSVRCDAKVRTDCVSVTEGFVANRIAELGELKRTKQALEACEERK